MKIYNEELTQILTNYDLKVGYLAEKDFDNELIYVYKPYTTQELKQNRMTELQSLLDKTDYIVTKLAEMQISNNENFSSELTRYQDTIQNRVAWRSELDRLLNE